jgi:pyruvate dehydrogenase E1 component
MGLDRSWPSTRPASTATWRTAAQAAGRPQGLGVSGRRRDRRAGNPGRHHPGARERLDNLIFVINCNLQRLDGPVRGNGKIIQELEAAFRGAGWNAIKVIWGSDWDPLLAQDDNGAAGQAHGGGARRPVPEVLRGRRRLHPRGLLRRVYPGTGRAWSSTYTDEQLQKLRRGGHDPQKVYAAYQAAVAHKGCAHGHPGQDHQGLRPGRGRRRSQHHPSAEEAQRRGTASFRSRFGIPIPTTRSQEAPFYRPDDDSAEIRYLRERRRALGGLPARRAACRVPMPSDRRTTLFTEFDEGSATAKWPPPWPWSTCSPSCWRRQENRPLYRSHRARRGAHLRHGEPVPQNRHLLPRGPATNRWTSSSLLYYKEAKDGQILEEGITEAGSMSSFIAAGTAYSTTAST